MKFSLIALLSILLISCSRTDDSKVNQCTNNCTLVSGHIVRDHSIGIANATIEFFFEKHSGSSSNERIIAKGTTDASGFFEIEGLIGDEELGLAADGTYGIRVNEASIPSSYIKNENIASNGGHATGISASTEKIIQVISTRDTTLTYNLIIPLKESLVFKVENFDPSVEG